MSTTLTVITGTSRGIGAGIAAAAASAGAIVASCNRTPTDDAHHLTADLSAPDAWPLFADWVGGLVETVAPNRLVFVHNAATLTPIGFAGEVDPAGYQANVLLNSAAPQVLGDAVARIATRTQTPTIVVQLSSGAGKNAYPGWTSYCAAKAAVDMWVRAVGLEQAERGNLVRALSVSPGVVATEMQAEIRDSATDAFPNVERFREMYADGELGDPTDIGARIWAAADTGTWPNGTVAAITEL